MPNVRALQRSFAGGEVSPEMFGRIDDSKYQSGLATCRNFITKPQGVAENRPGFAFVIETKDSSKRSRLVPFTYSTTQTMMLEMGAGYFRFHTQGATLLEASKNITGITQPAGVVTSNAHGYSNGEWVYLSSIGGMTELNGRYVVVSDSAANTFRMKDMQGNYITTGTFGAYTAGGTAAKVYEIANPYAEADLFDIHYVQSADVLTLVHPGYAPRELRRLGATNWQLSTISFAASIAAPGAPTATPNAVDTTYTYSYVVTSVASDGFSESAASVAGTCTNNLFTSGRINTISWGAVGGASRYNVYKLQGGLYGYIGQTTGTSIVDDNIAPDLSKTPPIYDTVFGSGSNYPAAVSYFEQRRIFAGTTNEPQTIWMTRSGTESDMSYSLPTRDDDRIKFRVAAREANTIRHIVPLSQLLLMTQSAEWRVTSVNSDAITPTSFSVMPQSYVGASNVQPVIVNNSLIYGAARGGHVRELGYNWQANGFVTGDMSLRATHLFDTYQVTDIAYSKAPQPLLWFVSSSGKLLGLTYVPEQQIGAWHQHDTDGTFESCAAVAEGDEDRLYCVIKREIDGNEVRYIERMASRQFADPADAFFVDCGATYDGAPADEISGLWHLEGATVNILADGAVHPQRTVTGGSVTLDIEASVVHIGLPIESDLQTLPLAMQIDGSFGQGRYKNVNKVWLRVYRSGGIFVGPDENHLVEHKQRTAEPYGSPPALISEEIQVVITPSWQDSGQVYVRQTAPLPLSVLSMTLEVALGG